MRDHPRLVTLGEAAEILSVPAGTLRSWRGRRKIMATNYIRGRARGGRVAMYTLSELQPHADEYHRRMTTRRTGTDT